MACTVPGCTSRVGVLKENNGNISFHRFPTDMNLRATWVKNVRKGDDWTPSQHTRICSIHFEDSCFREGYGRRILHSYAVPTIFPNLPPSCKPKLATKRKLIQKYDDNQASTSTAPVNIVEERVHESLPKINRLTQTENDEGLSVNFALVKAHKLLSRYKALAENRGKKLKNLQRKCSRLIKKTADLKTIIETLHEKMENEHIAILQNTYNYDCDNQVINKYLMKLQGKSMPKEYPIEIKKFALTLHFLSPKAYCFVRDSFNTILPHPKTLLRWYQSVDCKPGFTQESLEILKLRNATSDKILYCALCMDEVAIRKQLQWDGTKYYGHIDVGSEVASDDLPLASEALTFMLTCVNESWKIPVGYFLINGLTAHQKKNLVEQCIRLLIKHSVTVVSLTFDGAAANAAMAIELGCDLNPDNIKSTFTIDDNEVAILYDPCHNIKLVRNTLGEKRKLLDSNNEVISWHYLEMLQNLQLEEGLHAANKLSNAHIQYEKQKMKVKLATQLLSNSVADALTFCREMQIPGFEECDATIKFIQCFKRE